MTSPALALDVLETLLERRYGDRQPPDAEGLVSLAAELATAGYTSIDALSAMLERTAKEFASQEKSNPPDGVIGARFAVIGVVRISLTIDRDRPANAGEAAYLSSALTPESLASFLSVRYPDREPGEGDAVNELARQLNATGHHTLGDVTAMLNRNDAALEQREHSNPPDGKVGHKFSRVDAVRISLELEAERMTTLSEPADEAMARGQRLEEAGDFDAAERVYGEADAAGVDASLAISRLWIAREDAGGMQRAFSQAIRRGHVTAIFNTGVILSRKGRADLAEVAYRAADAVGDVAAACNLGILLEEKGDFSGAAEAYGRADRAGDGDSACSLGMMLEDRGDLEGARSAFERAASRGHGVGALRLGTLLEDRHDTAGAEAAYRHAEQLGESNATYNLGSMRHREGKLSEAAETFRRAESQGNVDGAYALGLVLYQSGDMAGARAALERAQQHGHPGAPVALDELQQAGG
jgi:tetratricopeptide (TPR) repeat protein